MIAAIMLVVAVGVLLFMVLGTGEPEPARHGHDPERDHELWVARERLTAGEIDADQYERIVHALSR